MSDGSDPARGSGRVDATASRKGWPEALAPRRLTAPWSDGHVSCDLNGLWTVVPPRRVLAGDGWIVVDAWRALSLPGWRLCRNQASLIAVASVANPLRGFAIRQTCVAGLARDGWP